jgi:acyl-CoA carboxylase subunit beta
VTASRVEPEEALWVSCPACGDLTYARRFARNWRVCVGCGAHARLTATERLEQLFGAEPVRPLELPPAMVDPLGFSDRRPYLERLREARALTGLDEAVVCVEARIRGLPVIAVVMDFRFMGGSLGCGVGERITVAMETALDRDLPLVMVTASGGARMQEGAYSLMQMAKTTQALAALDEAGVLTISLVTDPTFGGVAASFASLADVIVAEPGTRMGFAGRRVIEQTIGQRLPDGFQTAEFLLAHGLVDCVVPRGALRHTLAHLLAAHHRAVTPTGRRRWTTSASSWTDSRSCTGTGSPATARPSSAGSGISTDRPSS